MKRIALIFVLLAFPAPVAAQTHADPAGRTHSSTFLPAWTAAPIGIPTPSFGITYVTDTPPVAATHCTGWPSSEATNCWYVDRTAGGASDTGGRHGTPDTPRLTIPTSLTTSGTTFLVQVAGSGYTLGSTTYTYNGSSSAPIYVIAASGRPDFTGSQNTVSLSGDYFAFYGLKYVDININFSSNANHVSFAYNEVTGVDSNAFGWGSDTTDTVVYRNYIHNIGDPLPLETEDDKHGAKFSTGSALNTTRVWYVDNHVHDVSGDVIQCGSDPPNSSAGVGYALATWPSLIYIGRNTGHTTGENHTDIKGCRDVIISQNDAYDFLQSHGSGTDPGAAFVFHGADDSGTPEDDAGATRIWAIFNRIHHSRLGIAATVQSTLRVMSNLIYAIAPEASDLPYAGYSSGTTTFGSVMHVRVHSNDPVVFQHNTVSTNARGLNCEVNGSTSEICYVADNIFSSNTGASAAMGWEDSDNASNTVKNNLVHYGSDGMRFGNFGSTFYASLALFNAAGGSLVDCSNCIENGADFTDEGEYDLTLQATSDAIDAASDDRTYYDEFFSLYGISIKFDFAGNALPDSDADIGAFQFGSEEPGPGPGAAGGRTRSRLRIRGLLSVPPLWPLSFAWR